MALNEAISKTCNDNIINQNTNDNDTDDNYISSSSQSNELDQVLNRLQKEGNFKIFESKVRYKFINIYLFSTKRNLYFYKNND